MLMNFELYYLLWELKINHFEIGKKYYFYLIRLYKDF